MGFITLPCLFANEPEGINGIKCQSLGYDDPFDFIKIDPNAGPINFPRNSNLFFKFTATIDADKKNIAIKMTIKEAGQNGPHFWNKKQKTFELELINGVYKWDTGWDGPKVNFDENFAYTTHIFESAIKVYKFNFWSRLNPNNFGTNYEGHLSYDNDYNEDSLSSTMACDLIF